MRTVKRLLYRGGGDHYDAVYTLYKGRTDKEAAFRVWDVVGGDALVFLTPAKVRRLIADLTPHSGIPTMPKRRRARR